MCWKLQDATASSTYSAGNLYGNPVHAATRALSAGSGYWCSAGGHEAGETVRESFSKAKSSRRSSHFNYIHAYLRVLFGFLSFCICFQFLTPAQRVRESVCCEAQASWWFGFLVWFLWFSFLFFFRTSWSRLFVFLNAASSIIFCAERLAAPAYVSCRAGTVRRYWPAVGQNRYVFWWM